jgi:glycosyltransferase involved in cell wall biosynthesis
MPNIYPGWVARDSSVTLIISPRGTLSTWALGNSRWKKKVVWGLAQKRVLEEAACLHATAEAEYVDIRSRGFEQPVCVIPNGIDIPATDTLQGLEPRRGLRTILYVGRLHPGKGIDRLLRAWTLLAPQRPDWCLRIVGPDNRGHEAQLRALAASLRTPRVTFVGPAFGAQKWLEYCNADLYVLPTASENFGLTVAEALACGTPVMTTKGAPWSGLVQEACGWWLDHGIEPLLEALRPATDMAPAELEAMGARGRAWMLRDFSWDNIAQQMASVYRWLRSGGPQPSSIRLQ